MRSLIFFMGYLCVTVPAASYIANADPEPIGAHVSLLLFGIVGALVAYAAYSFSSTHFKRSNGRLSMLITGAFCAAIFFLVLSLVHRGGSFLIAGFLASVLLCCSAVAIPFLSRQRA
jgi:uncharacterized membrane protein YeaQ/YmgE (transglycosylase-associated protein family)